VSLVIAILLLLVAAAGAGIVFTRTPRRQVLAIAVNGFALALLFMALQAPDVAFAEIAAGGVAVPLLFLTVLASMKMDRSPRPDSEQ
jgi:uncharacterized MnhB-related membrane protein